MQKPLVCVAHVDQAFLANAFNYQELQASKRFYPFLRVFLVGTADDKEAVRPVSALIGSKPTQSVEIAFEM